MTGGRYRVIINGFHVQAETWDDVLNFDGKHDEVYASAAVHYWNAEGKASYVNVPSSPVMGDTWRLNGRVQAGSASNRGGLVTGDSFPTGTPWQRTQPLDPNRNWPPFKIWEGDLTPGQTMVTIAPGLNEWDPGASAAQSYISWAASIVPKLGQQVAGIIAAGKAASAVVTAISLGLDVLASMDKAGLIGSAGDRPIGMVPSATDPKKFVYDPQILMLTAETADLIVSSDPAGHGLGILEIPLVDDAYLRGNYRLYVQVEKVGDVSGQIDPDATYEVTAKHSGRALDAQAHGTANGTRLIQYDWWAGPNQKWKFTPQPDGTYTITNTASGRVVDADQMARVNGAKVQLWDSNGGSNQRWRLLPSESGFYSIASAASGRDLDVTGASGDNSAVVQVYDQLGSDNQKWRLTKRD